MAVANIKLDYSIFGIGLLREGFSIKLQNRDFRILKSSDAQKYFQFPQGIDIAKDATIYEVVRFLSSKNSDKYVFIFKKCKFWGFENGYERPCYYGCAILFETSRGFPAPSEILSTLEKLFEYAGMMYNEGRSLSNSELSLPVVHNIRKLDETNDDRKAILRIQEDQDELVSLFTGISIGSYPEYRRIFLTSSEEVLRNVKSQIEWINQSTTDKDGKVNASLPLGSMGSVALLGPPVSREVTESEADPEHSDKASNNEETPVGKDIASTFHSKMAPNLVADTEETEQLNSVGSDLGNRGAARFPFFKFETSFVLNVVLLSLLMYFMYNIFSSDEPKNGLQSSRELETRFQKLETKLEKQTKSINALNNKVMALVKGDSLLHLSTIRNLQAQTSKTFHKIEKDDSISTIAKRYHTTAEALAQLNQLDIVKTEDGSFTIRKGAKYLLIKQN